MEAIKEVEEFAAGCRRLISPFQISGFGWWQHEHKLRRLPVVPKGAIREILDELADNTTGGQNPVPDECHENSD